jgi:hypothetical protein
MTPYQEKILRHAAESIYPLTNVGISVTDVIEKPTYMELKLSTEIEKRDILFEELKRYFGLDHKYGKQISNILDNT